MPSLEPLHPSSITCAISGTPLASFPDVPSILHEALRELFAGEPNQLSPLLHQPLGLPEGTLVTLDSELTEPRMAQLLPDAVLGWPSARKPSLVAIVEIQLSIRASKRFSWVHYSAAGFTRYRCPVEILVVTPNADVEHWAAQPIRFGQSNVVAPKVLGPTTLPLFDAQAIGQAPAVGMLSTLAHMEDPQCAQQALWTLEALASWDGDPSGRLADILQAALTAAVCEQMEELMETDRYEYKSDFAKKYFARGREEGREEARTAGQARALLVVLRSREFLVSDELVRLIQAERDETRLDEWTRRAITVSAVEELFENE